MCFIKLQWKKYALIISENKLNKKIQDIHLTDLYYLISIRCNNEMNLLSYYFLCYI